MSRDNAKQATRALALGAWLYGAVALACETCRPKVQAGIFNEQFLGRLALTLIPWAVVLLFVALIVWMPWRRKPIAAEEPYPPTPEEGRP
jgi:hypothetical protein